MIKTEKMAPATVELATHMMKVENTDDPNYKYFDDVLYIRRPGSTFMYVPADWIQIPTITGGNWFSATPTHERI